MTSENSIGLSSSVTRVMDNDIVSITFRKIVSGKDAQNVQEELRTAVKEAMEVVAPYKSTSNVRSKMDVNVETDSFSVDPTHNNSGKINGYEGRATITVSSADTVAVVEIATRIKSMTVSGSRNSTSNELKASIEQELITEAIQEFNEKARAITEAFGYKSFTILNATVRADADRSAMTGKAMLMSMESMAIGGAMGSTQTVETGRSKITASVNGNIVMSKKKVA